MNTFHRFFVAGLLTGLSFTASADQMYQQQQYQQQQQQPYQQQRPYQQQHIEKSYGEKIANKAVNGFINIPTSPLEVPKSIIKNVNLRENNIILGVIGGVLEGSLQSVYRGTMGMIDLATFMIPSNAVTTPQYVWEDFYDTHTAYGDAFRLDSNNNQAEFELPK